MNYLHELGWRGLLHQTAGDDIEKHLSIANRVAYCGFDPTADSLTVGNFLAIKMLMHWQRCGHQPIVLMGGGTGLIGDPSGKDDERQLQSPDLAEHNITRQKLIFTRLLDFDTHTTNHAVLVNNYDWLKNITFIDALRDIGKYFSVNQMIQRDSIKSRLENREQGISYTEFSYMLLQAYDFLHLYKNFNCTVQVAGSDQYGNIVSGMDLVRRVCVDEKSAMHTYGVTNKLVTKSDGSKIGKSSGTSGDETIWLSADKTSAYKFYQFWVNTDDSDVIKFLKWFTFLEEKTIAGLEHKHNQAPHLRTAQVALAEHMTNLVHGAQALKLAVSASEALFGGDLSNIDAQTLEELFLNVPSLELSKSLLSGNQADIVDILIRTNLAKSKKMAREYLNNGAIYVNGSRVTPSFILSSEHLLHGNTILIRYGKKTWRVTRWL